MMKKTEIDNLFKNGKKSYGKILKVVFVPGTGEVIISAPIKIFKRAVDRNRVKRIIRESLREVDLSKANAFIIYNIAEIKSFEEIKIDLKGIKI
jgi:ribonuclease P protein component